MNIVNPRIFGHKLYLFYLFYLFIVEVSKY